MDDLEEIRKRRERRNLEIEQMMESSKENKVVTTEKEVIDAGAGNNKVADNGSSNKVSTLIHKFNTAAAKEAAECAKHQMMTTRSPSSSTSAANCKNFSPNTPTDRRHIGLIWDNINKELKNHKEAEKAQQDPNLSPRSRYGTKSPEYAHTISSYRSQQGPFKRGVEDADGAQSTSQMIVTTFSPSLELPVTCQRSESDPDSQSDENASKISVNGSGKDQADSVTGTTLTDTEVVIEEDQISQASASLSTSAENFRPITPTDRIIGSLWDEINNELKKYKEAKKAQQDPNLSPRSRYGIKSAESMHTISSYRSQQGSFKRGVHDADGAQSTSQMIVTTFSPSLELPEKRQRSESDPDSQSDENASKISVNGSGKDQADSVTGTTLTVEQQQQETLMKRLHEMIIVQQDQICQASRALSFCRSNDHFRGGQEEIDAQRALLISTERRRALLIERDRILNGLPPSNSTEPKGTLSFSSISLQLHKDYVNSYLQHKDTTNIYHFIVLIKCADKVFHTSLVSSAAGIKSGFIEFQHYIPITGISPDFVCELEVYSLKSAQNQGLGPDRSGGRSKKGTWRRMVISTPLHAYTNTFSTYSTGKAPRPIGVMDPGFQRTGHLKITRQLIGRRQKFILCDPVYPIDGHCLLNVDCHAEQNAAHSQHCEHRSFLSLYQVVSGFGSWTRYWCRLANGELNFWRYPEDETTKEPTAHLELSWCLSPVTPVISTAAALPNSIEMYVQLPSTEVADGEKGIKLLLAADTEEQRGYWIKAINQAIRNTSIWRINKRK